MAETGVSGIKKQYAESACHLPAKIEALLAELVRMEEFNQGDLAHCRATHWSARHDWHKILIDCYSVGTRRKLGKEHPGFNNKQPGGIRINQDSL